MNVKGASQFLDVRSVFSKGLKGRDNPAQGNALGKIRKRNKPCKGAPTKTRFGPPLQGLYRLGLISQGGARRLALTWALLERPVGAGKN